APDHQLEQLARPRVLVLAVPQHRREVEGLHCAFAAPLAPEALERARTLGCVACARHRAGALDLALLARGPRAVGVDRLRVAPQPEKSLRALSLHTRAVGARKAELQRVVVR